jgi:hypothetical protein
MGAEAAHSAGLAAGTDWPPSAVLGTGRPPSAAVGAGWPPSPDLGAGGDVSGQARRDVPQFPQYKSLSVSIPPQLIHVTSTGEILPYPTLAEMACSDPQAGIEATIKRGLAKHCKAMSLVVLLSPR